MIKRWSVLLNSNYGFVIIAKNSDDEIKNNLNLYGLRVYESAECKDIEYSVRCHPDLQIHPLPDGRIIVAKNLFEYYKNLLKNEYVEIICGEKEVIGSYPNDVPYNVSVINNSVLHNFKFTDSVVKKYYNYEGYKFLNCMQGYSGCSVLSFNNKAVTSDGGIYKVLTNNGIETLLIDKCEIQLPGQKYGFIGGASGVYKDKVFLTGHLKNKEQDKKTARFLEENGAELIYLKDELAADIGKIFIF